MKAVEVARSALTGRVAAVVALLAALGGLVAVLLWLDLGAGEGIVGERRAAVPSAGVEPGAPVSVLEAIAVEPGPSRVARGEAPDLRIDLGTRRPDDVLSAALSLRNPGSRPRRVRAALDEALSPALGVALTSRGERSRRVRARSAVLVLSPGEEAWAALGSRSAVAGTHRGMLSVTLDDEAAAPLAIPVRLAQSPLRPGRARATGRGRRIEVEWARSDSLKVGGYVVERARGGGSFRRITRRPVDSPPHLDSRVDPGTVYRYRVRAVAGEGRRAIVGRPGAAGAGRLVPAPTSIRVAAAGSNAAGHVSAASRRSAVVAVGVPAGARGGDRLHVRVGDGSRRVRFRARLGRGGPRRALVGGLDLSRLRPGRLVLRAELGRGASRSPAATGSATMDLARPRAPAAVGLAGEPGRWPAAIVNRSNVDSLPLAVAARGKPRSVEVLLSAGGRSVRSIRPWPGGERATIPVRAGSLPDSDRVRVEVRAIDAAGNRSGPVRARLRKDTRPPVLDAASVVLAVGSRNSAVVGRPGAVGDAGIFSASSIRPRARFVQGVVDARGRFVAVFPGRALPRVVGLRFRDNALNWSVRRCFAFSRPGRGEPLGRC